MKIAIDGPSGAGKSTIAEELSEKLGIQYLDTGSMYRAVGLVLKDVELEDTEKIKDILDSTEITYVDNQVHVNGQNVERDIRNENVAKEASRVSACPVVREYLVHLQRQIGEDMDIIMDGRDIGSVVLPDAEYKFFLTADPKIRAERRVDQLQHSGIDVEFDQVLQEIKTRDHKDRTRKISPLVQKPDSILVDNSYMDVDETVEYMINIIKENI